MEDHSEVEVNDNVQERFVPEEEANQNGNLFARKIRVLKCVAVTLLVIIFAIWIPIIILCFTGDAVDFTCDSVASSQTGLENTKNKCRLTCTTNVSGDLTPEDCITKDLDIKDPKKQCGERSDYWVLDLCICKGFNDFRNYNECRKWYHDYFLCEEMVEILNSNKCNAGKCSCTSTEAYYFDTVCECKQGRFGNFCQFEEVTVNRVCTRVVNLEQNSNLSICECNKARQQQCIHNNYGNNYICEIEKDSKNLDEMQNCSTFNPQTDKQRTAGCSADAATENFVTGLILLIIILFLLCITIGFHFVILYITMGSHSITSEIYENRNWFKISGLISLAISLLCPLFPISKQSNIPHVLGCSVASMALALISGAVLIICMKCITPKFRGR